MKIKIVLCLVLSLFIMNIAGCTSKGSSETTTQPTTETTQTTEAALKEPPKKLFQEYTTTLGTDSLPAPTGKQLAFPGAEGFGQYSKGGRGGKAIVVTNLNDSGAGSLRAAVEAEGPRTVIFAISGTVTLESLLRIKNSNITIAGQTAPGNGITLKKWGLQIEANDVIVRYIRVRLGDETGKQLDSINIYQGEDIIVDHCSTSWSIDENISIGQDRVPKYTMTNVTVSNCIIAESLWGSASADKDRGYGSLIRGSFGSKYTFSKNLFVHTARRIPRVGNYQKIQVDKIGMFLDFRNNVIYNAIGDWSSYSWGVEYTSYNFVGNYFMSGPNTTKGKIYLFDDRNPVSKGYLDANVIDGKIISNAQSRDYISRLNWQPMDPYFQTKEFDFNNNVKTLVGEDIYNTVMKSVGASKVYDSVDKRFFSDVKNKTGQYAKSQNDPQVGGWPKLMSKAAPIDSDKDGIPDSFENAKGLNPNDPNDQNSYKLSKSYSNLEVYLNSLVA